jgi:hypothetical protein
MKVESYKYFSPWSDICFILIPYIVNLELYIKLICAAVVVYGTVVSVLKLRLVLSGEHLLQPNISQNVGDIYL